MKAVSAIKYVLRLGKKVEQMFVLYLISYVLYHCFKRVRGLLPSPSPIPDGKRYDYIIIGGGTAGCVMAARLSEDPGVSVLLLEAGGLNMPLETRIPLSVVKAQGGEVDWQFRTLPQAHTADRVHFYPRGKVLGGSSAINYMLYVRGNREDYNGWAANGNPGWSYDEVLPYFIKSESRVTHHHQQYYDGYHGTHGPLVVTDIKEPNILAHQFLAAAQRHGIPNTPDYNGRDQLGSSISQVMIDTWGRRCSTQCFLPESVRRRHNLTIQGHCHVTKLLYQSPHHIEGVAYAYGEDFTGQSTHLATALKQKRYTVLCNKEVILCAGAIQSPQILQLSGIGDANHLASVGIECKHHLPGVGENLQDHIMVPMLYTLKKHVGINEDNLFKAWHMSKFMLGKGVFTSQALHAMTFSRTDICTLPGDQPDLQCHVVVGTADEEAWKNTNLNPPTDIKGKSNMMVLPTLLHPQSIGHVHVASANPFSHPIIHPNYLSHDKDMALLIEGVKKVRKIMSDPVFQDTVEGEVIFSHGHENAPNSKAYIMDLIRNYVINVYHYAGTCKMGPKEDTTAVVDHQLRVHGIDNLRVVDCSIMPSIVSANTCAPVIMIAEKAADMIRRPSASAKL